MLEDEEFQSSVVKVPKDTRTTADKLDEQRGFMRRFSRGDSPSIEELEKHATRYGTESVIETAAALGYGVDALVRLQDHCDRLEAAAYRAEHPHAKITKLAPTEDRVRKLLGIVEDEDELSSLPS
jgi:hypothetical protein